MEKKKFIKFFIDKRKELGYSQSNIASNIGISDQAVSNWERGISLPDLIYLDDIAKILETNVESLINGKEKNIKIKAGVSFDAERFSKYLLKLRKSKNLTQKNLGKNLGIPGQNISKFENGGFLPSVDLLEKYAKYFNLSIMNLYYGLDDSDLYEGQSTNSRKRKSQLIIIFVIVFLLISLLLIIPSLLPETHTVTIILGEDNVLTYQIKSNEIIELPELPSKTGYEASWNDTNALITEDKVFNVVYTPKKYSLTYKFENEEIEDYVQTVTYGEPFQLYIPEHYSFLGYLYEDVDFKETVYNYDYDITVIGKCGTYYKVTIILDKNNIEEKYIKENTTITLPALPSKIGYETSWDDINTLITEDKEFNVVYTPKTYTITYLYKDEILKGFTEEVKYGEVYHLNIPSVTNYSFMGYTYNGENIEDGIYNYDHDIIVYGEFSNEVYEIYLELGNVKKIETVGYGCSFTLKDISIYDYFIDCIFSPGEYGNYKIIAWKDRNNNIYEVEKIYVYKFQENICLSPIFAYYGEAFEIETINEDATIIKYNISKITELIIPDYIIVDNEMYKVTEISKNTFQDTYFKNIFLTSNITKIYKNTFMHNVAEEPNLNMGYIYYSGTIQEWFNIDFEEYIVSNKSKYAMRLYVSEFLFGDYNSLNSIIQIPEGIEVIKSYSLAYCYSLEVIIPNSVHTIEENAFIYSFVNTITNLENVKNVHENAFGH